MWIKRTEYERLLKVLELGEDKINTLELTKTNLLAHIDQNEQRIAELTAQLAEATKEPEKPDPNKWNIQDFILTIR